MSGANWLQLGQRRVLWHAKRLQYLWQLIFLQRYAWLQLEHQQHLHGHRKLLDLCLKCRNLHCLGLHCRRIMRIAA
jgi:hypothetical protein